MNESSENTKNLNRSLRLPLLKVLMAAGLGSRRYLAHLIMQNKVYIDGKLAQNLSHPVDPETNKITIDGRRIHIQPINKIVLILNKPPGTLSTTSDDRGRTTVIDILPSQFKGKGLYPVGRLDKDSTGLLIITNDGDLTYRLTHPKFEHEKEYLISINNQLSKQEIMQLENGIEIDGEMTYPAKIREITAKPIYCYSITIHEGKKNQIRRMFEKINHPVQELKRIRIGGLELGQLKEGATRLLGALEIKRLLSKKIS